MRASLPGSGRPAPSWRGVCPGLSFSIAFCAALHGLPRLPACLLLFPINLSQLTEEVVSLAGRVVRKAASGAKLIFFDLRSEGAKIQVMCDAR